MLRNVGPFGLIVLLALPVSGFLIWQATPRKGVERIRTQKEIAEENLRDRAVHLIEIVRMNNAIMKTISAQTENGSLDQNDVDAVTYTIARAKGASALIELRWTSPLLKKEYQPYVDAVLQEEVFDIDTVVEEILALDPLGGPTLVSQTIGHKLVLCKRLEAADRVYARALACKPDDHLTLVVYATFLLRQYGNPSYALELSRRAAELHKSLASYRILAEAEFENGFKERTIVAVNFALSCGDSADIPALLALKEAASR